MLLLTWIQIRARTHETSSLISCYTSNGRARIEVNQGDAFSHGEHALDYTLSRPRLLLKKRIYRARPQTDLLITLGWSSILCKGA